jgi:hypothetical protein
MITNINKACRYFTLDPKLFYFSLGCLYGLKSSLPKEKAEDQIITMLMRIIQKHSSIEGGEEW